MQNPSDMNPNEALYASARTVLPGGVSSSIRYNQALGQPFYIARGDGAYLYDLEGRQYVDLLTSHGATILGHNHPGIRGAIEEALRSGIVCSAETPAQSRVAAALVNSMATRLRNASKPWLDRSKSDCRTTYTGLRPSTCT